MSIKIYGAETQFLTIAYAKDVGLDPQNHVVHFRNKEVSREEMRLTPLLVYSLVAPAYSFYSRLLVDAKAPVPISKFLAHAWSKKAGLGLPHLLEVKQLVLSADRGYVKWIHAHGVQISSPSSSKSITAFERSSLDVQFATHWPVIPPLDTPRKLARANAAIAEYDIFRILCESRTSMEQLTFEEWNTRERSYFDGDTLETDWDPSSIVEKVPRRPSAELIVRAGDGREIYDVEGINEVVSMWPGGRRAFVAGLTINLQDFDFWLAGRAHLPRSVFALIKDLANISYNRDYDEWELGGGYLLIATSPRVVTSAYNVLSNGGDLRFSFEVLGPQGDFPAMRFLVFECWGGLANIILFERGGPAEKTLSEHKLLNMQDAVRSPPDVWETVTSIVEHREQFKTPEKVGLGFSAKHASWLNKMEQR